MDAHDTSVIEAIVRDVTKRPGFAKIQSYASKVSTTGANKIQLVTLSGNDSLPKSAVVSCSSPSSSEEGSEDEQEEEDENQPACPKCSQPTSPGASFCSFCASPLQQFAGGTVTASASAPPLSTQPIYPTPAYPAHANELPPPAYEETSAK